jgi:hypothetical protein
MMKKRRESVIRIIRVERKERTYLGQTDGRLVVGGLSLRTTGSNHLGEIGCGRWFLEVKSVES